MARKVYVIAELEFRTKELIEVHCRGIVSETGFGEVDSKHEQFLLELFGYHDEWEDKTRDGWTGFEVDRAGEKHTKCFYIMRPDGSREDISWGYAVRCIPTGRQKMSNQLRWFKAGARAEIESQIQRFRETRTDMDGICPVLSVPLRTIKCHVDHTPPDTFEQILRDFCDEQAVDPVTVDVDSRDGIVPYFRDCALAERWHHYHEQRANLRTVSRTANLGAGQARIDWSDLDR